METEKVWAIPGSLAATAGIVVYFLFLGLLRCFSSPAYRYPSLYIQPGATRHDSSEVSPFGNLRFKARLAAPRSLSQLTTSFVGILRQGILCARLSNFLRSVLNKSSIPVQFDWLLVYTKTNLSLTFCRHLIVKVHRCTAQKIPYKNKKSPWGGDQLTANNLASYWIASGESDCLFIADLLTELSYSSTHNRGSQPTNGVKLATIW